MSIFAPNLIFNNKTIMKKIKSMMLLLLVAVMGMCVQSCGSDDDDNNTIKTHVYYKYDRVDKLQYVKGQEAIVKAFDRDLAGVLEGINNQTVTEEQVIQRVQAVVDEYDNGVMMGEFDLKRSSDASIWKTIKTFTLTVDPKYIPE
jgi:hypothetical protein